MTIPRRFIDAQLEIVEGLIATAGRPSLRQAALRRAVSGAYYAAFHVMCAVCADELVGWSRPGTLDPIYRTPDHRAVRRRLAGSRAVEIVGDGRIGALFAHLQDQRHEADYAPPKALFSPQQARALVAQAREVVALVDGLSPRDQRLRLAILLIAPDRAL